MKQCEHIGCNNQIEDYYHLCYEHRKDKYIDFCKIHGNTEFIQCRCIKCKNMLRPVYRIYKRGKTYYCGNKRIDNISNFILKKYISNLTHRNKKYAERYLVNISSIPGAYSIFMRNKRSKNGIGKCLYIGQSVNIKRRIKEHQDNIKQANKNLKAGKIDTNIPKMYYRMAHIGYNNLKFICVFPLSNKIYENHTMQEVYEALAILEQYGMDCYEPEYNKIAARRTDIQNEMRIDNE